MEPRSWQWIQGAVIAAAMAIGIALAVWYENRPVASPIPFVAAKAPVKRKTIVHPDEGIITGILPDKPSSPGAVSGIGGGGLPASLPSPSQDPVDAWQKEATDPMAHSPAPATTPPPIVGTAPPPAAPETGMPVGTPSAFSSSPSPVPPPVTEPSPVTEAPSVTAPAADSTPTDSGTSAVSPSPTADTPGL